jgi:hypothetical protein
MPFLPRASELTTIYDTFLEPILGDCASGPNARFTAPPTRQKLAGTMVECYEAVRPEIKWWS